MGVTNTAGGTVTSQKRYTPKSVTKVPISAVKVRERVTV